jgi:hypothetical protein
MAGMEIKGETLLKTAEAETRQFHLLSAIAFIMFLSVAIIARILGREWHSWLPGSEGETSMLDGVRRAVNYTLPFLA